jgi:hypothetical protein
VLIELDSLLRRRSEKRRGDSGRRLSCIVRRDGELS